ncbi:hypothetical protein FI667_g9673, partial [Globisporangium splendens]
MARTAASVAEAHAAAASSSASAAYATALPRRTPGLGDMMNAMPSPPLSPAPLEPSALPFSTAPAPPKSSASDDSPEPQVDDEAGQDDAAERSGVQGATATETETPMDAPATATATGNGVDVKYAAESFPDRFPSWEALDAYVQEFKEHSYQMFGVRTSVPVKRRNERIAQRHSTDSAYQKLPESWQFYSRIYGCTHGVRPRNRGKGLRVHGSVRDTGCTARMNATLKVDRVTKLYYISVRLDGFHNHPCDKERYYGYPENRRIKDPALLRKVLQMHERGMSFGEIQRRLAKLIVETRGEGGVPTRADLHNTISRLKAAKQAETDMTTEPQIQTRGEDDDEEPYEEHEHDNADDVVDPSTVFMGTESNSKKRKADEVAGHDDDLEGFMTMRKALAPVKLCHLEVLLDTPYSYQLTHKQARCSSQHHINDHCLDLFNLYPPALDLWLRARDCAADCIGSKRRRRLSAAAIHLARQNIRDANGMIEWLHISAKLQINGVALPSAFADYAHWNKDRFLSALKLTPLTKTVIRGATFIGGHEFTDTIVGARVLRFCSNTNLDVDCMKAILLHLHARFADASFVCPSYLLETDERERSRKASSYGAFTAQKETVMGVAQLQSSHWGSFVLNWPKRQCFVYAPDDAAFNELKQSLTSLFRPFVKNVVFMYSPCPTAEAASTNASGILALLFLECVLVRSTWTDIPLSASTLDYYRLRYLMHATQVRACWTQAVPSKDAHALRSHKSLCAVECTQTPIKADREMTDVREILATAVGGFCGVYTGLPFGVVKTRLQTQGVVKSYSGAIHCFKRIAAEEGVASLWKGAVPALSSSALASATISSASGIAKSAVLALHARKQSGYDGEHEFTMLDEAIVGTVASVFSITVRRESERINARSKTPRSPRLLCNSSVVAWAREVWVCTLRLTPCVYKIANVFACLAVTEYRGPWDCLQKVFHLEGARGLFRGYSGLLLLYVPATLLFVGSHETYMSAFAKWHHTESTKEVYPFYTFASLGLAAATTWNVLYPAGVLKAQMQTASDGALSLRGAAKRVYSQHGIRGFYRGWSVGAMHSLSWTGAFLLGAMMTQHFFGTSEENK